MKVLGQVAAVVVGAGLVAAAVGGSQALREDVYSASSLIEVDRSPSTASAAGDRPENIVFLARSYAARATTRPVLEAAIKEAGLSSSVDDVRDRLQVQVSNNDATITVRAEAPTAEAAAELNTAVVDALADAVEQEQADQRGALLAPLQTELIALEQRLATLPPGSTQRTIAEQQFIALAQARAEAQVEPLDRIAVISPAEASSSPVAPRPLRAGLLAGLVALVVCSQLLVAVRYLSRRDRDAQAAHYDDQPVTDHYDEPAPERYEEPYEAPVRYEQPQPQLRPEHPGS